MSIGPPIQHTRPTITYDLAQNTIHISSITKSAHISSFTVCAHLIIEQHKYLFYTYRCFAGNCKTMACNLSVATYFPRSGPINQVLAEAALCSRMCLSEPVKRPVRQNFMIWLKLKDQKPKYIQDHYHVTRLFPPMIIVMIIKPSLVCHRITTICTHLQWRQCGSLRNYSPLNSIMRLLCVSSQYLSQ